MPGKKKYKTKKTSAVDPNADPDTMMGDGGAKGSKKVKKKKLTAAEKERVKLNTKADELLRSGFAFDDFFKRADKWMQVNALKCVNMYKIFDVANEGIISYDEFKAGLLDMNIPLSMVEIHLLCMLLDRDNTDEIEYEELKDGMKYIRDRFTQTHPDLLRPKINLSQRSIPHCNKCKLSLWDGECYKEEYPAYLHVHFKLITFDNFKSHPAHFKKLLTTNTSVLSLLEVIREETQLQSPKSLHQLILFRDKSFDPSSQLPEDLSLEECGFTGGPKAKPEHIDLYYDYKIEFRECPLLMSDHYFGQEVKSKNRTMRDNILLNHTSNYLDTALPGGARHEQRGGKYLDQESVPYIY